MKEVVGDWTVGNSPRVEARFKLQSSELPCLQRSYQRRRQPLTNWGLVFEAILVHYRMAVEPFPLSFAAVEWGLCKLSQ